ncbi:MAG: hypothetical protein DCC59_11290 [Chloroflexi bacterium]|nr:hypothetical protein [Chloroflexi bacterium CFX1]MCK6567315.1 hypothetical protein [Anaerolineales bacterium]MCQ3953349.1 hypothetical protein [Chloroflexota bacterium]MDL1920102.1 hypothetical protein [Chloroflexi bacterium CFX5]NUQ59006.1 hypothetical protein [Anaerolineales bacterium]
MLAPVHHIIGLTTIIRERLLPVSGNVLVRVQQKVTAGEAIAEARWAREHVLLDVARLLGVSPAMADSLIKCQVDDKLAASAEIAVGRGLFPRSARAPREGRVVAVGGGQVLMEVGESKMELRAGLPGTVIQVIPTRGVVIQSHGGLVQGVWGNGRIDSGLLVNLMQTPDSALTPDRMDVSLRGSIIMGGMIRNLETLQALAELPARGLIASSIHPSLISKAREMRYPILVTDGIGSLPMNSAAYKLLSTNAKREIALNAETLDRYAGAKPEIVIPLPTSSEPPAPNDMESFAPGMQVRIRRPPAHGMIGSIVSIKPGLTALPSGLRAQAAEVKLENNETIVIPLVNMEVVG